VVTDRRRFTIEIDISCGLQRYLDHKLNTRHAGIAEKKDGNTCANMTSITRMWICTLGRSLFISHYSQRNTSSADI
jgi:hypothetical protein